MTAIIVDSLGARPAGGADELAARGEGGRIFWLDVSSAKAAE